ncbi:MULTISPECIES: diphosphomevalonate decarboxylase [unclassified Gemella]|uniref:diphosphomevalonate decarboxylase n=1 Tax=unclassified Gemella TaxID=2624949 RepID=UPI001C05660E|nr:MULTISPECIES: diphosphomevalonate decarboxylase [unclassified Gemella]MBU0278641.1 diphosphomevalonate decarboxylase [Gemella sp. zg-1178]QWQ39197.1 diphosphomevalonate decarboxylase [Gemella sp. zg-570]
MDSFSIGYANIALVKYWGKKSKNPVLPYNPNISLRLDNLYSKTKIEASLSGEDEFYINDEKQSAEEVTKIISFINEFVPKNRKKIKIISFNTVPTAAGLSSSSSGTMALVLACNDYFKLGKTIQEMVAIAKEGSGSSCRSFYKMASWLEDGSVEEIKCDLKLAMLVLVVDENRKKISSRNAMELCVKTSTNFSDWLAKAKKDFVLLKKAIAENNFTKIGQITESNALAMHSTTKYATPPFTFLTEDSYKAMEIVKSLRNKGLEIYFTMDAGPNVKVLYLKENHDIIYKEIKKLWTKKIIKCMA